MRIITMDESHVAAIAHIETLCFSDPWSERSIASELHNKLSYWLVAMEGDTLVGYVGSQSVLGETDMMNIAVHPEYRRKGVAEALVRTLVDGLAKKGNHSLTLEVRVSNAPAIALYDKLGFCQVGRRPNYYHSPKEDALILRKEWQI